MLSGQQIRQIQETLLSAFPGKDELAMLVRFELNENLAVIAGGENLRVVVFKLVTWAESGGRIADLVEGAARQNTGNADLRRLVQDAATWKAIAPATPAPATAPAAAQPARTTPAVIDIFLSYSRSDSELMRRVQSDLRAAGFTVWIDEGLEPGTPSWQAAIQEAIHQAHCLVVLLSPSAKGSVWVNREVSYASHLGRRIIPLLADGVVSTAVPISLIDAQWVDIRQTYEQAMRQQLLPVLQRHLRPGEPVTSAPAPAQETSLASEQRPVEVAPVTPQRVAVAQPIPINFDWVTIPAGEFLMGSDKRKDKRAYDDEKPQHTLNLPAYRIARVPVTNAQYKLFIDAAKLQGPAHWEGGCIPQGKEEHPVVQVTWHDAVAFCAWAGVRLPTEAEWEKAARGGDGRIFPWGNQDPTKELCNFNGNVGDTTAVGRYPKGASPYGLLDMAGNVWEWTMSLWGSGGQKPDFGYPYRADDGRENLEAPDTVQRTLRGGSWSLNEYSVRCAARYGGDPDDGLVFVGFRVVSPGF